MLSCTSRYPRSVLAEKVGAPGADRALEAHLDECWDREGGRLCVKGPRAGATTCAGNPARGGRRSCRCNPGHAIYPLPREGVPRVVSVRPLAGINHPCPVVRTADTAGTKVLRQDCYKMLARDDNRYAIEAL